MLSFAWFVVLLGLSSALIPRSPGFRRRQRYLKHQLDSDADYPWVQTMWFNQTVDHFDPNNNQTWSQKYFYNDKYYRGHEIIFLMIGGEGPESKHWAGDPNVTYITFAQEYGALIMDLEHRFFGESYPVNDMNTDTLRLLTSRQALADLANFIDAWNKNFTNPRWVVFGGSYPGALTAWFREKYPNATVGGVASSGVVNTTLDFYQYAMGVNDDLTITKPDCASATKASFNAIQQYSMTVAGRNKLNDQLHLDPPFGPSTTKLDITNLFGNLYNIFQDMSQYTYDGQNIESETNRTDKALCDVMTNPNVTDPVDRIYNLIVWWDAIYGTNSGTFDNSYWGSINPVATGNLTELGEDNGASRGWMWLCCNELGFMQTTDMGDNVFGSTIPLNYFIDMCTDMFGPSIKMDHVYNTNNDATNYYGASDGYSATNVVLPNGSLDPWHFLGTYPNNTATGATSLLINGTAHCSDMYPPYVGEPPALVPARKYIKSQVQMFINYDPAKDGPQTTVVPTTPPSTSTTTKNTIQHIMSYSLFISALNFILF